jgi:alpha-glucosidase
VLALRRDLAGERSILAVFNLSGEAQTVDLPQSAGAEQLQGYGLPGGAADGKITLPAYGAWFGYAK